MTRDKDFDGLAHGMAQMVRNTAALAKYRVKVSVQVVDDHTVTVQVVGKMRKLPPEKGVRLCRK